MLLFIEVALENIKSLTPSRDMEPVFGGVS